MIGRDLAQHIGVIDDGAEVIDRLQRKLIAAHIDQRRVVRRIESDYDVGALRLLDALKRTREDGRADLGAAAAAAHGDSGNFLERLPIGQWRPRRRRWGHFRKLVELAHEAAIDPILPAPYPCTLDGEPVARSHRMAFAGRDQIERLALRTERPQGAAAERAADVVGEHRTGAHGIDAGLR